MVTEDYVSFEIAKLLKNKGFDWDCESKRFYPEPDYDQESPNGVYAPTVQMAMKWLREVHNISIEPLVDFGSGDGYWWTADVGYIKKHGLIDELCGYNSYEQVCEAAIKYCLENLI